MSSGAEPHPLAGSGRALLATLAARALQFLGLLGFHVLAARSLSGIEFGALTLGLLLVQLGAVLARRGMDQALLGAAAPARLTAPAARSIAALAAAIGVLGALLAARGLDDTRPLALVLCGALLPVAVGQFVTGALRAQGRGHLASLAETAQAALALGAAAIAVRSPSALSFALGWGLSWLGPLVFALALPRSAAESDPDALRRFRAVGWSMAGVYLLGQVVATADGVLLGSLGSIEELARYAPAQRIAGLFAVLHSALVVAAIPMLRQHSARPELLGHYLRLLARLGSLLALPLAVVAVGAPALLTAWFGDNYSQASATPLRWLALAGCIQVAVGPLGNALLAAGRAHSLMRVTLTGTGVFVAALALAAPHGASAAAAAVLLATIVARGLLVAVVLQQLGLHAFSRAGAGMWLTGVGGAVLVQALTPHAGPEASAAFGATLSLGVGLCWLHGAGDLDFLRQELFPARRS
jgi:O-antigen/teichoic acid export membrane protein